MTQHLVAYYQDVDNGGAYGEIDAVKDTVVFTSNKDIRIPSEIANVMAFGALTAATTVTACRLTSPRLREIANPNFEPIVNAVVFGSQPELSYFPLNPMQLNGNESIRLEMNTDAAAASVHYGLVWLSDGPQQPVNGAIFSLRGTVNASLTAGQWANGDITFDQTLPDGQYQVVGMSARSANLVAARIFFVGGRYRPGVPAVNAIGDVGFNPFRYGRSGVFGEFDTNQPPTIDCLGVTDTSQTIILDLIKVA